MANRQKFNNRLRGGNTASLWTLSGLVLTSCGGGGGSSSAVGGIPQIALTFISSTDGSLGLMEHSANLTTDSVYTAQVSSAIAGATIRYDLASGFAHNDLFNINPDTGGVTFKSIDVADYENDRVTNGAFMIRVIATATHPTEGSGRAQHDVTITLMNQPEDPVLTYTAGRDTEIGNNSAIWENIGSFAVADPDKVQGFADFDAGDFRFGSATPDSTTGEFTIANVGTFRITKSTNANDEQFLLEAREVDYDAAGLSDVAGGKGYTFGVIMILDPDDVASNAVENVRFTVMPPPDPMSLSAEEIYENHPVHKAVYAFTAPNGATGAWSLPVASSGGTADNALFRIDAEGNLWWKDGTIPDYESPADEGDDNTYDVKALFTTNRGIEHEYYLPITVGDIERELLWVDNEDMERRAEVLREAVVTFRRSGLREADIPDDELAQSLLGSRAWEMPQDGPLVLTWSLVLKKYHDHSALDTPEEITTARNMAKTAFAEFEKVANLKFIEVNENEITKADISMTFGNVLSQASAVNPWGGVRTIFELDTVIHEIGHALGLKHPFEPQLPDWPGSHAKYYYSPHTVMSYARLEILTLQKADIEALQFLYGAPGTDYEGIESLLELGPPRAPIPASGGDNSVREDDSTGLSGGLTASGSLFVQNWSGTIINYEARHRDSSDPSFILGDDTENSGKGATVNGKYGTFYLKTDGSWSYEIDNARPETDALTQGDKTEDTFEVRAVSAVTSGLSTEVEVLVNGGTTRNPSVFSSGDEGVAGLSESAITTDTVLYTASDPVGFTDSSVTYSLPDGLLDNGFFDIVASGTNAGEVTFRDAADADADRDDVIYQFNTSSSLYEAVFKIGITANSMAGETATQYVSIRLTDSNDTPPVFDSGDEGFGELYEAGYFFSPDYSTEAVYRTYVVPDIDFGTVSYQLETGVLDNDLFRFVRTNDEIRVFFKDPATADYEHADATNGVFNIQITATATHSTGNLSSKQNVAIRILDVDESTGEAVPPPESRIENSPAGYARAHGYDCGCVCCGQTRMQDQSSDNHADDVSILPDML